MITVKKHSHLQVYRDVSESPGLVYHIQGKCVMLIQTSWKKLLLTRIQKAKFKKSGIFYHAKKVK